MPVRSHPGWRGSIFCPQTAIRGVAPAARQMPAISGGPANFEMICINETDGAAAQIAMVSGAYRNFRGG